MHRIVTYSLQENPAMAFEQLMKHISSMYTNLSLEEKAPWVSNAKADKAFYDEQIAQYVPPPGHDVRRYLIDKVIKKRPNQRRIQEQSGKSRCATTPRAIKRLSYMNITMC